MKFRFTIGRRIGIGFGTLIVLTLAAFVTTNLTLKNGREKTNEVTNIYTPSVSLLSNLDLQVVNAQMLITNWVFIQNPDDVPGKIAMRKLLNKITLILKHKLSNMKPSGPMNIPRKL